MKNLLIELFVEELPPKALKKLGEAFATTLADSLKSQALCGPSSIVTSFASPRRLGVHVTAVAEKAPDKPMQQKLMPVSVGLNAAGEATPALLKKLGALGANASAVPALKRAMDGKAEALFYDSVVPGVSLPQGLQKALDEAVAKLPIPKVMSYQLESGVALPGWDSVAFVRPAHALVALHGAQVVAISALGLQAGRETRGHRFEANTPSLSIDAADSYETQLEAQGAVIPSFAKRRAEIVRQLAEHAPAGTKAIDDEALLDEVTALVERPNVMLCQFEKTFLDVPQECLILTMKANQKYFPLLDAQAKLTHQFLIVSNISPADPSAVISGNEKVVRPRLADAKFFFDQDRKRTLESRVPGLDKVVYHGQLGTQGERMERVRVIAQAIAAQLGDAALVAKADIAARLAKADLLTDMVGEFPELQGIMGGYYARHDGLGDEIAIAIEDHYKPRFAGDSLPRNQVGLVVALADKLETLVGLFGIGQVPTGDKDPFSLRRHALGILRMLAEAQLPLDLDSLIASAVPAFGSLIKDPRTAVQDFVFDRLAAASREQGYSAHEVDAVLSQRQQRIADIAPRLNAVLTFAKLPEAPALAAANKRISNILKKSDAARSALDAALLTEAAEKALWTRVSTIAPDANARYAARDYTGMLQALSVLKPEVDTFFNEVMVNADDPAVRANRLALLSELQVLFNRVADLSKLAA